MDKAFHQIVIDLIGTPTELVTPEGRIAWRTTSSVWGRSTTTTAYLTPDRLGLADAPNDHAYVPNPLVFMDPLGLVCGQRVYR